MGEVPSFVILAPKFEVVNYVTGKGDYLGKQEGWAAHYGKDSVLICLDEVCTDKMKSSPRNLRGVAPACVAIVKQGVLFFTRRCSIFLR